MNYNANRWINVMDEGAVGDGVHDDTRALQRAHDKALSYGWMVVAPALKFKFSRLDIKTAMRGLGGNGYGANARTVFIPTRTDGAGSMRTTALTGFDLRNFAIDPFAVSGTTPNPNPSGGNVQYTIGLQLGRCAALAYTITKPDSTHALITTRHIHTFETGDSVVIANVVGMTGGALNFTGGTYTVTRVSAGQFSVVTTGRVADNSVWSAFTGGGLIYPADLGAAMACTRGVLEDVTVQSCATNFHLEGWLNRMAGVKSFFGTLGFDGSYLKTGKLDLVTERCWQAYQFLGCDDIWIDRIEDEGAGSNELGQASTIDYCEQIQVGAISCEGTRTAGPWLQVGLVSYCEGIHFLGGRIASGASGGVSVALGAVKDFKLPKLANGFSTTANTIKQNWNVLDEGADPTGGNDSTAAWERAMAHGGTIDIPGGIYELSDCTIPIDKGDITLNPLGKVTIKHPLSGSAALAFDGSSLVSADVEASSVAEILTFPTTTVQAVTKITAQTAGEFSAFVIGDICSIRGNEVFADSAILIGEMFTIIDATANYIIADRLLYFTYTPGTGTPMVNRITSKPKITINKGITFVPKDSPTGVMVHDFKWALAMEAAVRADIDVEVEGTYSGAVYLAGCFDCDVNAAVRNCYVDYASTYPGAGDAWGYGVSEYGMCFGNRITVHAYKSGKAHEANGGTGITWVSHWSFMGIPQSSRVDLETIYPHQAGGGPHMAIRPHYRTYIVRGMAKTDLSNAGKLPVAISGACIDGTFDNVVVENCNALINLKDQFGTQTTMTIKNLSFKGFDTSDGAVSYGLVRMMQDQTNGTSALKPIINILNGNVSSPKAYAIDTDRAGDTNNGYIINCHNVVFSSLLGVLRWKTSMLMVAHLHNCTVEADSNMQAVVVADATTVGADTCFLWGLDINIASGASLNGLGRVRTSGALTVMYGSITVNKTPFKWRVTSPVTGVADITHTALNVESAFTT